MTSTMRRPALAIYLPDLGGGGAERLHINLAPSFVAAGYDVTFLLDRRRGELLNRLPEGCSVVALDAPRQLKAVVALARYLRTTPPDILVANMEHMNIMALAARAAARAKTRIVATQHNTVSEQAKRPSWQFRILRPLYRAFLRFSDAIVAVSAGVADDLARFAQLDRSRIEVVYNGVIEPNHAERAARKAVHPWFAEGAPVVVAAGRLTGQKDFQTLLRAIAQVDRAPPVKLLLLGEGPLRGELETLASSLGLAERVAMPGFEADILPSLRAARMLVLSSRFEGFGNVVAEALGCGTPVVSTDCPHGPAEILDHGRYGRLVPVGDSQAMARAIEQALGEEPDRQALIARSMDFTVETCANAYLAIFDRLRGTHTQP
ncbi:glycosyltransferase [Bosea sp. (in: a-proteobacteria)]|uniref:glycosyltransferase n=1 Tax=Bosea sp. (in: a-proteobacteria) TaxID=1871050 RepID=UPI00120ADA64|nr:glycosyltransferase [Bosea sp. (in: a-proteobacteria)]TAJ31587.1 MAG: glycosyltransferase [Bosea sp. (in: a-proteobacteria)]